MSLRIATFAALAAALSLCACARETEQLGRARLQHGIEAMERGDYAFALATCEQCATDLPEERSAQVCRLVSAVHLQDWVAALSAAEELGKLDPESDWAAAVALDLARRLNRPAAELTSLPAGATGLWACLEGWCRSPDGEAEPPGLGAAEKALLAVARGEQAAAIRNLEAAERKGAVPGLLALLYLKAGNRAGVVELLPHLGCSDPVGGVLGAQLALFLQEPAFFRAPGCPPAAAAETWPAELVAAVAHLRGDGRMDATATETAGASKSAKPSANALMLDALGRPDSDRRERLKLLEEATASDPLNAVANLNLAVALLDDSQLRKAAYYLSRAKAGAADPRLAAVYLYLTDLLSGDVEGAAGLLEQLRPTAGHAWVAWLQGLEPHRYFQSDPGGVQLDSVEGDASQGGRP